MAGGRARKAVVCRFCTTCQAAQKQHDGIEPVEAALAAKLNKELDMELNPEPSSSVPLHLDDELMEAKYWKWAPFKVPKTKVTKHSDLFESFFCKSLRKRYSVLSVSDLPAENGRELDQQDCGEGRDEMNGHITMCPFISS
ncbi:unnamed protein product [Heligmosomoides polygyrus]|uniref:Uncharacterized protein n=1 Tax=Heligmosomoides polygyrus TaxID=6339 RepID=A0A183GPH9_HELPZ|nr:unnamed protein product [Heligmosomoides polygyrus]